MALIAKGNHALNIFMVSTVDRVEWPIVTSRENRLAPFDIGLRNRLAKTLTTTVLRNRLTVFMVTTVDRVQWPVVTSRGNRLAQFGIGLRNRSAKAPATTVLRNRLTVFMVTAVDSHRPEEQVSEGSDTEQAYCDTVRAQATVLLYCCSYRLHDTLHKVAPAKTETEQGRRVYLIFGTPTLCRVRARARVCVCVCV